MRLSQLTNLVHNLTDSIKTYTETLLSSGQFLKDSRNTAGKIVEKEFILDVSNSVGWNYKYIVFPFDIDLISGTYESVSGEEGDIVTCSVMPPEQSGIKGIVGMMTETTISGAETINLPTGVGTYFDEGAYTITLFNTSNADINTKTVTNVSGDTISIGKISEDGDGFSDPMDKEFPTATTAIILERDFATHRLLGARMDEMGEDAWGSSTIPSGYIIKAGYYNSSSSAKKVRFIMDYFCGKKTV